MQFLNGSIRQLKIIPHGSKSMLAFGIILPIFAIALDPFVFQGVAAFSAWSGAGYALVFSGAASMAYWLLTRRSSHFLAGLFAAYAFFTWLIGIVLFIPSVLGIMAMGIGLLGFIPFGTAYVFSKAARIAWKDSPGLSYAALRFCTGILLALTVLSAFQFGAEFVINRGTEAFFAGHSEFALHERLIFAAAKPFGLRKNIVRAWMIEKNPVVAGQVAMHYHRYYGTDIRIDEVLFFD